MIVVIPAYEPDEKLLRVVAELKRDTDYAIVVVNDGSSEAAEPVFAALPEGVTLLRHAQNRGKGRALKTACDRGCGRAAFARGCRARERGLGGASGGACVGFAQIYRNRAMAQPGGKRHYARGIPPFNGRFGL